MLKMTSGRAKEGKVETHVEMIPSHFLMTALSLVSAEKFPSKNFTRRYGRSRSCSLWPLKLMPPGESPMKGPRLVFLKNNKKNGANKD